MSNATFASPQMSLGVATLKMAGALFFLLAFILLLYYLLRRFGPKSIFKSQSHGELEVLCSIPVNPKKSLLMVRFLNKKVLIGVSENTMTFLSEVEVDHDKDEDFGKVLEQEQNSCS
ncbi:flagellar protein FliO/FliZ [Desulfonauticus submarinus]|uniref:Flagellar protein n=1 Tax=Desulfonauticus submarinus TaxID=206665 RepID=A0A1H0BNP8_9BACT|nr:flagellar biosynthetic protein FliO [Desulfonauticus submarinus]SDN47266.1 flagellar protein FliO/FliZ [Desulfonauticus submarinus]